MSQTFLKKCIIFIILFHFIFIFILILILFFYNIHLQVNKKGTQLYSYD